MSGVDTFRRALDRMEREGGYTTRLAVTNALDHVAPADAGLVPIRVAILRDLTVEPLVPVLRAELAASRFAAEVWTGDFDTIGRDALGSSGELGAVAPDLIIIVRWLEQVAPDLATRFVTLSPNAAAAAVRDVTERVNNELAGIRAQSDAPILLNTFPLPDLTTLGILDAQLEDGHRRTVEDLNREILRVARTFPDVLVVDLARLVGRVGSRDGIDERGWQTSRAPLARPLIIALAAEYARFVRALRGGVRKCLVLDCDDTLWGGVVGEDGLAGIRLDPSYPGSAYLAFQREVLNLRERGILLALASKNNEADVLDVLRDHPHMLIRVSDFAAWRINWQDKATNLEELATELNIGIDSLVFADDNEFECDLVRQRLPEVAVIHLGAEPSLFASKLLEAGLFDSLSVSRDDRTRAEMVGVDRARTAAQRKAPSMDEYLISLAMKAMIDAPVPNEIPRVAQLTQKTNQFNLTTVRHTEGSIARLAADPAVDVHVLHLRDRFSELGLVGVAIVTYEAETALIETFLMSCRVLGRGVEDALLARIEDAAAARGAIRMRGMYRRTARNGQVATFYENRGFAMVDDDDGTIWERDLRMHPPAAPGHITIRRRSESA